MDEQHSSHDQFFEKLNELFAARKGSDHGAIYLTQKRLTYNGDSTPVTADGDFEDRSPSKPMPVIVRATNGKSKRAKSSKSKLSTVVQPHDLESFYLRYAEVCKAGMAALKPRDRSKNKAKAKAKKKKITA
ncbi:Signal recognition particle, SRP9/SRP14 subunit [Cordyceps fumosorosea ARSEF 2679]|uniref:Signal recognition particle subunit SRP14 n=1 Tax=Cordyceps fumosorosea (strain ARSEF 2679) TaxID=1081104 RepID=A0A162JU05_CORFA|nr:Signal recognition particle, SRP9/SRP14 subunit [Cordyceps fumosorosea ARSEF 2679]OAA73782.1 Signal recognition particle, SRP9/SRP14 subunit [Cordyceps fumosorosea ARSEF 2679]